MLDWLCRRVGERQAALALAAIAGSYSGHAFGMPYWPDAVDRIRARLAGRDAGPQGALLAGLDLPAWTGWQPDVDDDAFWALLRDQPERLGWAQAEWAVVPGGIHQATDDARHAAARKLGGGQPLSPFELPLY